VRSDLTGGKIARVIFAVVGERMVVKNAHRSKTVKAPYTINRMRELEKNAGAYADQIRPLSSI